MASLDHRIEKHRNGKRNGSDKFASLKQRMAKHKKTEGIAV
jgi:hypothetical protein